MSQRWQLWGVALGGLILGIGAAWAILTWLPGTALPPWHPVVQALGIRKPVIMGFMPYWLLTKTQSTSLAKLNNVTYFGLEIAGDGTIVQRSTPQELEPGWNHLDRGTWATTIQELPADQVEKSLLLHLSDEDEIRALLASPTQHAQTLMTEVAPLMRQHGFTDLNLDIESFATASQSAQMQMNEFLKEVRRQVDDQQLGTLTIELLVTSLVRDTVLQPQVVGELADRVVLMAYDFSYRDSFITGAAAPVGGAPESIEYDVIESVKLATRVISPQKLILGIPLYGYEWETLTYQPASPVVPGTGKTATHLRVEELKRSCPSCQQGRDEVTGAPYIMVPPNDDSSIQQIYYDDATSIQQKLDLAQEYKLGGVALWAIGYESPELLEPLVPYRHTAITQP